MKRLAAITAAALFAGAAGSVMADDGTQRQVRTAPVQLTDAEMEKITAGKVTIEIHYGDGLTKTKCVSEHAAGGFRGHGAKATVYIGEAC